MSPSFGTVSIYFDVKNVSFLTGAEKNKAKTIIIKSLKDSLIYMQAQEEAERRAKVKHKVKQDDEEEIAEEGDVNTNTAEVADDEKEAVQEKEVETKDETVEENAKEKETSEAKKINESG